MKWNDVQSIDDVIWYEVLEFAWRDWEPYKQVRILCVLAENSVVYQTYTSQVSLIRTQLVLFGKRLISLVQKSFTKIHTHNWFALMNTARMAMLA